MPKELWPLFRDNRRLGHAFPALAAKLIEARARAKYGARVGVIGVLHTFNGQLEFNSHVHTMFTGGGLHFSSGTWIARLYFERDSLMMAWRRSAIVLLRAVRASARASLHPSRPVRNKGTLKCCRPDFFEDRGSRVG